MAISGQEIVSLIKRQIEEFGGDLTLVDVGTVVQVAAKLSILTFFRQGPNR